MAVDKGYMSGSSRLLVLNLLSEKPCYGYELIKTSEKEKANLLLSLGLNLNLAPVADVSVDESDFIRTDLSCLSNYESWTLS